MGARKSLRSLDLRHFSSQVISCPLAGSVKEGAKRGDIGSRGIRRRATARMNISYALGEYPGAARFLLCLWRIMGIYTTPLKEIEMSVAESFGRSGFATYVNTPAGRIVRIIAGLALIGWGYVQLPEATGIVLIIVGLVPLAAGIFNLCLISALLGGTISGARIARNFHPSDDSAVSD